jgi:hypothetical protein
MANRARGESDAAKNVGFECVEEAVRLLAIPDDWYVCFAATLGLLRVGIDGGETEIPVDTEPQIEALIAALALDGEARTAAVRALAIP